MIIEIYIVGWLWCQRWCWRHVQYIFTGGDSVRISFKSKVLPLHSSSCTYPKVTYNYWDELSEISIRHFTFILTLFVSMISYGKSQHPQRLTHNVIWQTTVSRHRRHSNRNEWQQNVEKETKAKIRDDCMTTTWCKSENAFAHNIWLFLLFSFLFIYFFSIFLLRCMRHCCLRYFVMWKIQHRRKHAHATIALVVSSRFLCYFSLILDWTSVRLFNFVCHYRFLRVAHRHCVRIFCVAMRNLFLLILIRFLKWKRLPCKQYLHFDPLFLSP